MIVTESDRWQPLQAVRHPPCRIWRKPPATTPGKGGPSGIARGETAQVLTVASGSSADRSRATAMGRRPGGGRWPCRAGRLTDEPARGASSPARQGVTDSPRSLRIFADHLSETAQVTDAGRLTCVGAAGEARLAPLRRASVGLSSYGRNQDRSSAADRYARCQASVRSWRCSRSARSARHGGGDDSDRWSTSWDSPIRWRSRPHVADELTRSPQGNTSPAPTRLRFPDYAYRSVARPRRVTGGAC